MSLLDDVSIVVTPNGYKAGELYAVIPVPTEGAEEGTNMDFSSGTSPWALNSNWSLGGVGVIADGTSNSTIWQSAVVEDNKQYIVTYTLTDFSQGSINVDLSGGNGITRTLAGTYTEAITAGTSPTTRLSFEGSGNFKVTLSNVIVKEYRAADMDVTRATAATRVDEDGLVNYAEIIGGEEVANGDFESGTSGWTTSGGWSITDKATNSGSGGQIYPVSNSWKSGVTVRFSLTVSNRTTGYIRIQNPSVSVYYENNINTNNSFVFEFTTVDLAGWKIEAVSGFDGSIDNISVKEVTRDNVPRIDYTGGGCPHILAEPQRTNLFEYSESFNETEWSKSNVTVVDNSSQSPDGANNASLLYPSSSGDFRYIHNSTTDSNSIYTISAFVKASGKNVVWFYINSSSQNGFIYYDLSDQTTQVIAGSSGTPTATIISYGNDWYKISYTSGNAFTLGSGSGIGVADAKGDPAVTTNGTDGVLVWGLQLEAGSYPTSYIPNFGTALGVTRNQDIFTRDGIGSLINSPEGVLFLEVAALADDGTNRYLSINDGTTNNYIYFRFVSTSNTVLMRTVVAGVTINTLQTAITDTTDFNKFAFKWKSGDYAFWINGVEELVDTSATIFGADVLNQINFDFPAASGTFPSKVRQLQVYNTALSDDQIRQITQ